jgi:hypothetical protein
MPRQKKSKRHFPGKKDSAAGFLAAAATFEPSHANPEAADAPSMEARIRQRAYEIFLGRGSDQGSAEQDWLQAEVELRPHSVA